MWVLALQEGMVWAFSSDHGIKSGGTVFGGGWGKLAPPSVHRGPSRNGGKAHARLRSLVASRSIWPDHANGNVEFAGLGDHIGCAAVAA
jgi:hypothetical protein